MSTPSHGSTPGGSASSNFDMRQQEEMWVNFNRLAKWIVILCVIVLVGMAVFLTGSPTPQ
jgi:hypothetical protein